MPQHAVKGVTELLELVAGADIGPQVKHPARDPVQGALVRTTSAVTVFHGGVQPNVLPKVARATINFRVLPGDSRDTVLEHLRSTIADPDIEIEAPGFREPPRPGRIDARGFGVIREAIAAVYAGIPVIPGVIPAGTDSKHYAAIAADLYRFIGYRVNRELVGGAHGTNERVQVEYLDEAVEIAIGILKGSGQ